MKFTIFTFVLLSVITTSYSEDMGSADADYCIDWLADEEYFNAQLVFVKKYNDLKIQLNKQGSLKCVGRYHHSALSNFYFMDTSGREDFAFGTIGFVEGMSSFIIEANSRPRSKARTSPSVAKVLQSEIQLEFPDTASSIPTPLKRANKYRKEDLLQLKGKVIGAYIENHIQCPPDLDTVYRVDFRAKITGWCGCGGQER